MPVITEGLTISQSLYDLIQKGEPECCKILQHVFKVIAGLKSTRFQPYGFRNCDCQECRETRLKKRPKTRLLAKERIGDYFTFRERDGMISYMPKGRVQEVNEDGTWVRKGRAEIKPAKWIKSMIHPRLASRLKDDLFTKFDTLVKAEEAKYKVTFKEVSFEEAYDYVDHYSREYSIESCMWGEDVGPFYRHMGAKVVVAVNREGKFRGRAVVWPSVKVRSESGMGPITLMDRIYCDRPELENLFKEHAKAQGWYHKKEQGRDSKMDVVGPEGAYHCWRMAVTCRKAIPDDGMYYPYLDTFTGGEDEYTLVNNDSEGTQYCQTDGSRQEEDPHEGQVQTNAGDWIDEGDAVSINGDCYDRNSDDVVMCHRSDSYILREESFSVQIQRNNTVFIHSRFVTNNS